MIHGIAKRYDSYGNHKRVPCEIVRLLPLEGKALIRYPGYWRVFVKALGNVEVLGNNWRPTHGSQPGTPILMASGGGLG